MNTAGRRRKQAIQGYPQIRPRQRPVYNKVDSEKSKRRTQRLIEKQNKMRRK